MSNMGRSNTGFLRPQNFMESPHCRMPSLASGTAILQQSNRISECCSATRINSATEIAGFQSFDVGLWNRREKHWCLSRKRSERSLVTNHITTTGISRLSISMMTIRSQMKMTLLRAKRYDINHRHQLRLVVAAQWNIEASWTLGMRA